MIQRPSMIDMSRQDGVSLTLRRVTPEQYERMFELADPDLIRELEALTFVLLSRPEADRFVPAPLYMRASLLAAARPPPQRRPAGPIDELIRIAMDTDTPCATEECAQARQLANQIAIEVSGQELLNCTGCQLGRIANELYRALTKPNTHTP